jgi:hypothetical protein
LISMMMGAIVGVVNMKTLSSGHLMITNLCLSHHLISKCNISKMKRKECMQVWSLWNHRVKRRLKGRMKSFKDFTMRPWKDRIGSFEH